MQLMSRISKVYLPAARNEAPPPPAVLRRGRVLVGDGDEIMDLFTRTRRGYQISSSSESIVPNRIEKKASIGSAKAGRSGADEFFSVEIGKHDYKWLLTPPGTPLFSSVDSNDHQTPRTAEKFNSNLRPASIVKTSKLSGSQSENSYHGQRPGRSSSTTRASLSTSSRTLSVLNTSSASVNSRPTTPSNRTRTPSVAAPRYTASRLSTPARARPNAATTTAIVGKPKPAAPTSRSSTPNPSSSIPASSGLNSNSARLKTRPSTPTRRSQSPAANPLSSSPVPRSRAPVQPIIPPDFRLDAPPNFRKKLPERAISAGRQRPGMALNVRANSNVEEAVSAVNSTKRASSPAVARGRVAEAKGKMNGNWNAVLKLTVPENKPGKQTLAPENGYGCIMSKNSFNMALKHMDIREVMGNVRGASLFPHSTHSTAAAAVRDRPSSRPHPTASTHKNRSIKENGSDSNEMKSKGCFDEEIVSSELGRTSVKTVDMNLYGSSSYESMLLKEDARSLNWLHSLGDKTEESYPFDHQ